MPDPIALRRGRFLACMALASMAACTEPGLDGVELEPVPDHPPHHAAFSINKDVDILFVIDDSSSMAEEQRALASAFGRLVEVLERPDVAANYRIGITTTDNGNPWCTTTTPEAGSLRASSCRSRLEGFAGDGDGMVDPATHACTESCPAEWADIEIQPTAVLGSDERRPRPWIESVEGRTNLPEGLGTTQALQCLGPQGIGGCGFEAPLESMWKALWRARTEDDPAYGFIRSNAVLSIVHVTDEADCSYDVAWESMFLPEGNRVFWSDADAEAPTSAVCWNAGVACEGTSPYTDCRSVDRDVDGNEVDPRDADELAVLHPVSRYVDLLQELEDVKQVITPDQQVLVSVIGGVGLDGGVTYRDAADPGFQRDFGIGPGCDGPSGSAVPPVRLRELAEAFQVDTDRTMFSSCEGDYSAALAAIGEAIAAQIQPACMPACVADTEPSTPDVVEPSCTFSQESPRPDGSFEVREVPLCEDGDALPDGHDVCWTPLVGDERSDFCADVGFNLELRIVRRTGVPAPGGTAIVGRCELSPDKRADCPDLP